jgi:hypothetical protein
MIKFGLSEEHTKFEKIFLMVLTFTKYLYLQSMRKIEQSFVSFSESPNINQQTAQIIRFLKILA